MGESSSTGPGRTRQPNLILAILCMTILLDALDLSITQVALPSVGADLQASLTVLPWVVNAYVLTYGGLLLLGGRLCDLLGRRRVLVVGLAVFGLTSLVAGLASHLGLLITARAVQGVGAALTVPAALAILAATFPQGDQRNRALGIFAAFAAAGFSAGLVAGGALTATLGWPWVFLVKVPIVGLTMVAALISIAPDADARSQRALDAPGALTGTVGLLLLALAVTLLATPSVSKVTAALTAFGALVILAAFGRRETRAEDPLLPGPLLRNRVHLIADLGSLTVLAAPFGFAYLATTYLQEVAGYGPLRTGLAVLPGAVLSGLVSRIVAPRLLAALGIRRCAVAALVVVAAGMLLLVLVGRGPSYVTALLPACIVCLGIGMGVAYPVFTIAALTDVPEEDHGAAAGIQNAALQIGGGLGLAVVSSAVALVSGGRSTPDALVSAVRVGAVVAAGLPLLGAAAAFFFPSRSWAEAPRPSARTTEHTREPLA